MSSYLSSYFGTGSSSYGQQQYQTQQAQQQYPAAQTGQSSTWTSTFSSRIATLRKALTKDSEEDDLDSEDCSHVSNVLRAYYTEKGRPFPDWLPPDPKKPAVQPTPQQYGQYGSTYGNQPGTEMTHGRGGSGGRGGLSDLWDSGPAQPAPQTQSLRAPRPAPQSLRSHDASHRQGSGESYTSQGTTGARPLPSQRVGSYQTNPAASPPVVASRDRLRARLQGGGASGRNSPAQSYQDQNSYGFGDGGASQHASASQSGSNNSSQQEYDPYRSAPSATGHSNPAYRQRPGGPR